MVNGVVLGCIYCSKLFFCRAAIKMRDQCGVIFRQARRDLEAAGLLPDSKENVQLAANSSEDSLASDIDKELENLQVLYYSVFQIVECDAEAFFNI